MKEFLIIWILLNVKILNGFQSSRRIMSEKIRQTGRIEPFNDLQFPSFLRNKVLYALNPQEVDRRERIPIEPIEPIEPISVPETAENGAMILDWNNEHLGEVATFLLKSGLIGTFTGLSVVLFKSGIAKTSVLFYEDLANILPKPYFYWPIVLYPLIGSMIVSALVFLQGDTIRKGIDSIASSIDSNDYVWNRKQIQLDDVAFEVAFNNSTNSNAFSEKLVEVYNVTSSPSETIVETPVGLSILKNTDDAACKDIVMPVYPKDLYNPAFDPWNQFVRLVGAIATLGSGCSLGPEGPSVEIGAGWSRLISFFGSNPRECRHLFLAGTAAGVAAGFNAPIAGVFFALECGNRYLSKNTVKLNEYAPDGPRADIAAIVTAAGLADIITGLGLHESNALSVQGNGYAMVSPFFELPLYMGLGIICGGISVAFTKLRNIFTELFVGKTWGKNFPFAALPTHIHPLFGGIMCGLAALFFPQTLFVGYATLDQLLAGKIELGTFLILQLLGLKLFLSAFSLGSGLIGGVFAPALFFGATAGTAYHDFLTHASETLRQSNWLDSEVVQATVSLISRTSTTLSTDSSFITIADAPAYATVGAAATLGALFRAPLTASMLMFELTQNHDIVLPVLVSTGIGGLFAELINHPRRLW